MYYQLGPHISFLSGLIHVIVIKIFIALKNTTWNLDNCLVKFWTMHIMNSEIYLSPYELERSKKNCSVFTNSESEWVWAKNFFSHMY